jgi:hypothetical protein
MPADTLRYFTVMGRGEFPLDMLRYDQCHPYRSEDAAAIGYNSRYDDPSQIRTVVLVTTSPNSPTPARWSSFLWGCKSGINQP